MSSSSSFDSPLFVRDTRRRYRPANADQIIEAARQVVDQRMQRGTPLTDPSMAGRFFRDKLAGLEREVFAAVFLDTRHRLIDYAELFFGTVDGAEIHPREVVRQALLLNAAAIVVAHNRIYGTAELQSPRSPYQVMAGTVIPAALLTAVNSDLPGQVIASVTEQVYDSVTGRHLLIPQGSRLIGQYDSQVAYGQRRVLLVWTRLIRPDGSSLVLDRLPATDAAGQAGVEDAVDWHWHRIVAGAALSTLIGVGAELAAPDRNDANGRIVIATRESVQETVNQVGQQVTRRNVDLQPTLTVRAGFPVRVMVSRDLVLRPFAEDRDVSQLGAAQRR